MLRLDNVRTGRWLAVAGPALLLASIPTSGAGCSKPDSAAKKKAEAPGSRASESPTPPRKRPTAPVKVISLEQCLASKTGDRVTLEGYIRFAGDALCGKTQCSVGLLPRAEARGGRRASVRLPITKQVGKPGIMVPKPGFKPGDLVIYDARGKRVRIGQPVRATGTLRLMDAKKGYRVLCRIDAARLEIIPRVTSPMHPAAPKRAPIASVCKDHPDGTYVRVQGFPKVPGALSCVNACDIPFYEKAGHTGAQIEVSVALGKGPNRMRDKPPSIVGRDGTPLTPAQPVVVVGTVSKPDPDLGVPGTQPTADCQIEAERIWQAKH